jgi:HK97 family phage prohead protease
MNDQIKQEKKEYKNFNFEYKEEDNNNEEFFYFTGYASVFNNIDYGNDVIEKGAFKKSIAKNQADKKYIKILWQHEMEEPIGIAEELAEDTKGLRVIAKLPLEDELVRGKVKPQVKIGSVREMSIGYIVKDFYIKDGIRYIKEVDLKEISLVTIAMNPLATINDFKSFINNLESLADVEYILKNKGFSNTEAKTLISKVKEFSKQRDVAEDTKQRDVVVATKKINEIALIKQINNLSQIILNNKF